MNVDYQGGGGWVFKVEVTLELELEVRTTWLRQEQPDQRCAGVMRLGVLETSRRKVLKAYGT